MGAGASVLRQGQFGPALGSVRLAAECAIEISYRVELDAVSVSSQPECEPPADFEIVRKVLRGPGIIPGKPGPAERRFRLEHAQQSVASDIAVEVRESVQGVAHPTSETAGWYGWRWEGGTWHRTWWQR